MEWNSSLYINFIDYEKAFDSVDTLWKLLEHYGIPEKIITIIQQSYEGMTCRSSGAQGPAFRLLQCHDWRSTRMPAITFPVSSCYRLDIEDHHQGAKNGIQWTIWSQLEDLDFANNLALLSHNHEQMQTKTTGLAAA